jgi:predicted exporter
MGRPTVVLWLIGVAACVVVVTRAEISTDMSAFLPRAPAPGQQILVEQLRDGVVSRLVLVALEGAPPDVLAQLSKALAARLRTAPDFALVANGEEVGLDADRDWLWRNRYLLSPAVTDGHFSAAALHRALERDLTLLGSSAGLLVKRSLPHDPTGEILVLIDRLAGDAQPPSRDGVWLAADGSRAVLLAHTRAAGFDIDGQARALAAIDAGFAQAQQAVAGAAAAHLITSGPGVFAVRTRLAMQQDVSRLSLLATALVAGLLLLAYGAVRVLLLALLPVLSGALAGIAAVELGFGFVHGITLGFGVTLIGEAVDYAIYLFTQTAPGSPTDRTLPRIWPTLRLGMLTSVCGFSAMLLSSFTGFAQLGLFTIVGLVVALAVTRWVLPVLLPRGFTARRVDRAAAPLLARVRAAGRLRWPLAAVVLVALALLAWHRGPLWEDELQSLSPIPAADQQLDQALRRASGAPDVRHLLLVSAAEPDAALAASERLGRRLVSLTEAGELAGFESADRYLPSLATQRARQAALPDRATLQADLQQALVGLPFRAEVFAPFLDDVAAAKAQPLLTRDSLRDTGLALRLDSLLFARADGWVALLPLRGVADPQRLADTVAGWGEPGVAFLDLKRESDQLLGLYRSEALTLSLLGVAAILVLLAVSLRAPRRVAAVAAPLAGAVAVTAALLTLGAARLSIFNLFGLLLVVAVGSNYCLFFERQDLAAPEAARTVASLVLANLCTVIGFGVLALSRIPVLHGIGTTVAIGALLSLVFAAVWTPHGRSGVGRSGVGRSGVGAPAET